MADEKKKEQIEKIVVQSQDELIDIVRKIETSKADRIVLTFAEESDLLISPINLKVILQAADEKKKVLVNQIVQNPTGVINSRTAGIITTDLHTQVEDDLWLEADTEMKARVKENKNKLKQSYNVSPTPQAVDDLSENDLPDSVNVVIPDENPILDQDTYKELREKTEADPTSTDLYPDEEPAIIDSSVSNETTNTDNTGGDENIENIRSEPIKEQLSPFQQRVRNTLDRTKTAQNAEKSKVVQEGDFVMALDEDINSIIPPQDQDQEVFTPDKQFDDLDDMSKYEKSEAGRNDSAKSKQERSKTLVGKDFYSPIRNNMFNENLDETEYAQDQDFDEITADQPNSANPQNLPRDLSYSKRNNMNYSPEKESKIKSLFAGIAAKFKGDKDKPSTRYTASPQTVNEMRRNRKQVNWKAVALKLGLPLLVIILLVFFFLYSFLPTAKVQIYIESKPISAEKTFTGEPGSVFDLPSGIVAVKVEEIKKERAESTSTTGTAYRGTKAKGVIHIDPVGCSGTITLPSGTSISNAGKNFITTAGVTFDCTGDGANVAIEATAIGDEYNINENRVFSVGNYLYSVVQGDNLSSSSGTTAITGGTKEAYKAVAKSDIDNVAKALKEVVFAEATSELKEMRAVEGWEVIESSIKNELDGDPKSDYGIGIEADLINVTIKTKSRAIYYKKIDLETVSTTVLLEEAKKLGLYEANETPDVDSLSNVVNEVSFVKLDGDKVTVKLVTSGNIKPAIEKEEIVRILAGKSWDEGVAYLESIKNVVKPTEYEFSPSWFPRFLWSFPNTQNKILVRIETTTATSTSTPTSTSTSTTTPPSGQ